MDSIRLTKDELSKCILAYMLRCAGDEAEYIPSPTIPEYIDNMWDQWHRSFSIIPAAPEELWDEYSEYIDDDIDSLSVFAGSSVINRSNFIKAINSLK